MCVSSFLIAPAKESDICTNKGRVEAQGGEFGWGTHAPKIKTDFFANVLTSIGSTPTIYASYLTGLSH